MRKDICTSSLVFVGRVYIMKLIDGVSGSLRFLRGLPLSWLHFSPAKRLLIVTLSYIAGMAGLWFLFPRTFNGVSMFLPIICASWLFKYRGMLISLVLNGFAFQLLYLLLLRGLLPDSAFAEGAVTGFFSSLALGLIICWLRTTVDEIQQARQRALVAEYERLQAIQTEQQVTQAYEQQRKMNELKDQFLLNVSHELRTPLTVLGGFLELLDVSHKSLDDVQRTSLLKEALASKEELVELVDAVLAAANLLGNAPKAMLEAVSVPQIVQEVLTQLDPEDVQRYTVHLHMPEEALALADAKFLREILRHLFSNIFKYVYSQTELDIEVSQADAWSTVYLSVQDAGPGIPTDELLFLFEKGVRLKRDLAGSTRGLGLGLYICNQLVQAMGGHIWAESSGREGDGARFCLTLPPFYRNHD